MDEPQLLPPKPPQKDPKGKPTRPNLPPQWRSIIWYIPLALFMLWFWQDMLTSMRVKTIPYSEFKQYLANNEVTEAEVKQDEIDGKIDPKPAAEKQSPAEKPPTEKSAAEKSQAEKPAAAKPATQPATAEKNKPAPAPAKPAAKDASKNPTAKSEAVKPEPAKPATEKQPSASAEKTAPTPAAGESAETEKTAPEGPFLFRTIRVEDPKLVDELVAHHVQFVGTRPSILSTFLFAWILPILFFVGIYYFLTRRMGSMGQTVMSIGKSKAKLVGDKDTGISFNDVAGCDEAKYELQEVVDFLKNPSRYQALGAKIPKGILLVGPPGTGKTLLARAVAGEAHVPFFSISGSDFVEMFVGVGASRVRDLFEQAKKNAPCIIFIDEIDAIGGQRSVHVGLVNDEREQTLNQLLSEMDGFEANVGVLILGATNRPDILDRALLRPGRFDRQVVVDSPDIDGREAILKVHSRDKRLAADVNLRKYRPVDGRLFRGRPGQRPQRGGPVGRPPRRLVDQSKGPRRRGGKGRRRAGTQEPAARSRAKASRCLPRGGSCAGRGVQRACRPRPQDQRGPPRPGGARLYAATAPRRAIPHDAGRAVRPHQGNAGGPGRRGRSL